MRLAFRRKCPKCKSKMLYKERPKWWMRFLDCNYYVCDSCETGIALFK